MPLTNDDLTVWELAHRLAGSDPHKRYWFSLPLSVKDNIRLLVNEILSYRLTSSLIMEHRPPDSDLPSEYYVRHYLDEIYACIWGQSIPTKLVKSVSIDRWDFWQWCQQTSYEMPEFWFSVEYRVTDDDASDSEEPETDKSPTPTSPREANRKIREQCRVLAREIWGRNAELPIAQVAREVRERGLANHFGEKTVVNWIRSMAPEAVRGRSGRPKNRRDF